MALDEQKENSAYAAVNEILASPWASQRERILKNIVRGIMVYMNWNEVKIENGEAQCTTPKETPK